jgi:hypothetical protein
MSFKLSETLISDKTSGQGVLKKIKHDNVILTLAVWLNGTFFFSVFW